MNNLKRSLTLSEQASKKPPEIPGCEAQLPAAKKLHPDEASNRPPLSSPAKKHERFQLFPVQKGQKTPFMKTTVLLCLSNRSVKNKGFPLLIA
ncbi:hypothetical protein D5086_001213 [Populus alba]|uniref:Uncharacterized protein n=1 Tax=Populus alba TaxID=43335 RepID=A0ACC4CY32_POPAL